MKKVLFALALFISTSAFADSIILHIWTGRAYTSVSSEAEWDKTVNAYVVSNEAMIELSRENPQSRFYANGSGLFGRMAGLFRWQYLVVPQTRAAEAAEKGEVFAPRDATEAMAAPETVTEAVTGSIEVVVDSAAPVVNLRSGSAGEPIFHGNLEVGPGYFYRRASDQVLINAVTQEPVLFNFSY